MTRKTSKITGIAVLLAVFVCFPGNAVSQELTDRELRNWIDYILDLEERVSRNTDDAQLLLRLADAYVRIGDARRALPAIERLIDLGIEPLRVGLLRGDLHLTLREYDEAVRAYLGVLSDAPNQPYALTQLWRLMLQSSLSSDSVTFDRQAVISTLQEAGLFFPDEYSPTADGPEEAARLVDRANSLVMRDRSEEAAMMLMQAISLNPGNAEAFASLARAYDRSQEYQSAIGASLVYLLLAPDAPDSGRVRMYIGEQLERLHLQ